MYICVMSIRLTVENSFFNHKNHKPVSTQLIKFMNTQYHCHDFIEFFYVLDGKATHRLNDVETTIEQGDAFLLLPDDNHSFEDGDKSFLHRDIMLKIDFFKSICDKYSPTLFDDIMNRKYPLSINIEKNLETRIEKLAETFEMEVNKPTELLEMQIGYEIVGSVIFSSSKKSDNNKTVARLVKVLSSPDYFKYSINEILSLEDYGYCHEYICRLFKKKADMTMTAFFNTNKIEYALTLKQTGFYTVSQIREIVNIENESYFYKLLKKHTNKIKQQK